MFSKEELDLQGPRLQTETSPIGLKFNDTLPQSPEREDSYFQR